MNCKFCDAPLDEGSSVCPACGVDNDQLAEERLQGDLPLTPEIDETPETETEIETDEAPDADLFDDDAIYAAASQAPTTAPEPQPVAEAQPKKAGKGLLIVLGLVAVAAVAALVLAITGVIGGGKGKDPDPADTSLGAMDDTENQDDGMDDLPTVDDGSDPTDVNMVDEQGAFIAHDFSKSEMTAEEAATVVAKAGKQKLTNADLSYYYWQQYYNLYNSYGMYISMILDPEQPLATQMYDETHSWQDKLLQASMLGFRQSVALSQAAEKANFTLGQEYTAYLDSMEDSLSQEATANGFESVDALLQSVYGPAANLESYLDYARTTMLGSSYLQTQFETLTHTDADVTKFFEENPDQFQGMTKDDPNMVNVRHILITPQSTESPAVLDETTGQPVLSDADWAAAETQANTIYEQWKSGEATEASFSALAAEHSADGSSQNGGLIEDIYPGQMVPEFNDWCFDAARKPGDHAVVKTQFGYHIMYFSSMADRAYWFTQAETALQTQQQQDMVDQLVNAVKIQVDYSKVVLVQTQQAAAEEPDAPASDEAQPEAAGSDAAQPDANAAP